MSNKGKKFTEADLPRFTQQRIKHKQLKAGEAEAIKARLAALTERNKIVAKMDDGTPLIAEELAERAMRVHATTAEGIDGAVLSALRTLQTQLTPEQRSRVLGGFDDESRLVIPFKKAK
jgi:N-dimethylarginine dimethylaminohydrolase